MFPSCWYSTSGILSIISTAWEILLITIQFYWKLDFSLLPCAVYNQLLEFSQWYLYWMISHCPYNTFIDALKFVSSQLISTSANFSMMFAAWELILIKIEFYWWLAFNLLPRAVYIQLLEFFPMISPLHGNSKSIQYFLIDAL